MKVLLCGIYFSESEGYFRLSSWGSLWHLHVNPLQLPIARDALERSGSYVPPLS